MPTDGDCPGSDNNLLNDERQARMQHPPCLNLWYDSDGVRTIDLPTTENIKWSLGVGLRFERGLKFAEEFEKPFSEHSCDSGNISDQVFMNRGRGS